MRSEVQTYSEDFQSSDYQISGDIQWVRNIFYATLLRTSALLFMTFYAVIDDPSG